MCERVDLLPLQPRRHHLLPLDIRYGALHLLRTHQQKPKLPPPLEAAHHLLVALTLRPLQAEDVLIQKSMNSLERAAEQPAAHLLSEGQP